MAVLGPYFSVNNMNGHNSIHSQLTKSLEKILEDAYLSGELKLGGRKLKEFPKPVKYDLGDTVIADLSKNRFSEVPAEVTNYVFLEKLFLSQNVIRTVPDGFGALQSLSYLDLSSNQLTELPREICQLPIQILLVTDNNLTSLPKEIGRMSSLVELEASHNALTQVPITLGDCVGLRALDLSNNQLGLLPLQITYLQLEYLNISCNCISSLPLELRNMSSLVSLKLDNNPLVSPPTTVCMRGRIHIFKYLENMANKDNMPTHKRVEDTKRPAKHNSFVGTTAQGHQITSGNATIDCLRHRPRPVVDSGYCTDGVEKRWSNEGGAGSGRSTPSTPSTLSPGAALSRGQSLSSESSLAANSSLLSGVRTSPEGTLSNGDDKTKLSNQQTYRQYKEALKQQRQQDVYRPRTDNSSPEISPNQHSPVHLHKSHSSPHSPLSTHTFPSPNSPTLYHRTVSSNTSLSNMSPLLHSTPRRYQNGNEQKTEENKRPVQKVVPSRNTNKVYPTNGAEYTNGKVNGNDSYIKPTSPVKSPTSQLNGVINSKPTNGETKSVSFVKGPNASKMGWNKELAADKLSFTMKREFDKQKEESDLLQQLRTTIESRLRVQLPSSEGAQLSAALSDGVVLCHLANLVRPRLVASVHVPSPAQPKLTMARCRRNVENFIDACRRIGVDEDDLCSAEDVTELIDVCRLARTVAALLAHATPPRSPNDVLSQSRTSHYRDQQTQDEESQSRDKQIYTYKQRYTEERYVSNFNYSNAYTIDESEEYMCENVEEVSYAPVYASNGLKNRSYANKEKVHFVTPYYNENGVLTSDSLEIYDTDEVDFPVQNDDSERYDRSKMNLEIKNNLNCHLNGIQEASIAKEVENKNLITGLCLGAFFLSAILLFMYPL